MKSKKSRNLENAPAKYSAWLIIGMALALVFAVMFTSCKTPAAVTTDNHVDKNDSARTELKIVHDTIIIHDTIYRNEKTIKVAETESETTIHFGEGGGTYNAKTGDATNVTGVGTKESKREHELKELNEKLISENTTLHHAVDSLSDVVNNYSSDSHSDTQPVTMNKWERFIYVSGIVAWCVIIILIIIGVVKLLRKFKVIPV